MGDWDVYKRKDWLWNKRLDIIDVSFKCEGFFDNSIIFFDLWIEKYGYVWYIYIC